MDTKYMNKLPENIDKLLKSSNPQDVLLGVIWCKRELGTEWCKTNFTFVNHSKTSPRGNEDDIAYHRRINNYPTYCTNPGEELWIKFKDCDILLGPYSIEYFDQDLSYPTQGDIIYEE